MEDSCCKLRFWTLETEGPHSPSLMLSQWDMNRLGTWTDSGIPVDEVHLWVYQWGVFPERIDWGVQMDEKRQRGDSAGYLYSIFSHSSSAQMWSRILVFSHHNDQPLLPSCFPRGNRQCPQTVSPSTTPLACLLSAIQSQYKKSNEQHTQEGGSRSMRAWREEDEPTF